MRTHSRLHSHHHLLHFMILLLLISTGFFAFFKLMGYPQQQFQIITVTALAYFFWGIFHHLADHDLNWKIVVEYLSIAFFIVGIVWALLFYNL